MAAVTMVTPGSTVVMLRIRVGPAGVYRCYEYFRLGFVTLVDVVVWSWFVVGSFLVGAFLVGTFGLVACSCAFS